MEDLEKQLAEKDEDVRIRDVQMKEMEKREDELQHKLKAGQAMYESVRAERNLTGKSLGEAEVRCDSGRGLGTRPCILFPPARRPFPVGC